MSDLFTPDELAAHVQQLLSTQTVNVPQGHKLAFFAGLTTDGAKAAVAWRPSEGHDWTVNVYDDVSPSQGNVAGVEFKGSL